jgi:hypothetical protein
MAQASGQREPGRVVFPLVQAFVGEIILNGATDILVPATPVGTCVELRGTCRSDRALTLTIYQGPVDGTMNAKSTVSVPGSATEGAGVQWTVPIYGSFIRIDATNASGTNTAVLSFEAKLLGGT